MANKSLHAAKDAKNDEFYTRIEDINEEMNNYEDKFRDKIVFCNCDDPKWSNFWKYFHLNFEYLGLKKLITTHYEDGEVQTYKIEYEGGNDENFEEGIITPLTQNGDFRSPECLALLDEADIVVTNPPFSLFREYISILIEHDKEFIIIGNMNAITYKEVFLFIRENKVWLGCRGLNKDMYFDVPDERKEWLVKNKKEGSAYKIINGVVMGRLASACWFTNLDHSKRHREIDTPYMYSKKEQLYPDLYPKYDNYDAINVDRITEIPMDYEGIMGVPITFLDKYNPEQFEIIGMTQRGCHDEALELKKYDDYWEVKQDGKRTGSSGSKTNGNPNLSHNDGKHNYFINAEGHIVQSCYQRILIRKKVGANNG